MCLDPAPVPGRLPLSTGCACRGPSAVAHVSCLAKFCESKTEQAIEAHDQDTYDRAWTDCPTCTQCFTGKFQIELAQEYVRRYSRSYPETFQAAQVVLANAYQENGMPHRALKLRRPMYRKLLSTLGPENKNTLVSGTALATSLKWTGQKSEAEALYRALLPMHTRTFGPTNSSTVTVMQNLSNLLMEDRSNRGKCLEGLQMARAVMEAHVNADPAGVDTATAKLNVAKHLGNVHPGNIAMLDQSVALARDVHSRLASVLGRHHFKTAHACEVVAACVLGWCKAREQNGELTPTAAAEALLGCVEEISRSVAAGSPGAPENAQRALVAPVRPREITRDLAAGLSFRINSAPEDSRVPSRIAERGYELVRALFGMAFIGTLELATSHAEALDRDGRPREAAVLLRECLQHRSVYGDREPLSLWNAERLASILLTGDFLLSDSGDRAPEADQREGAVLLRQTARDWGRLAAHHTGRTAEQRSSAARSQEKCVAWMHSLLEMNGHCPDWPGCEGC